MIRYDYKVHPLADLFPDLPPDEFEKLKADIHLHGQQDPIVLNEHDMVLDGRHRLKACMQLGVEPRLMWLHNTQLQQLQSLKEVSKARKFILQKFPWETSPMTDADYIWSKNVLRRHLTDDQRAMLGVQWSDAIREAAKQRMRDGGKGLVNSPNPLHTREAIAKKARVSTHKVRQAEAVAKKSTELPSKVSAGEMKLRDAERAAEARPQNGQPQRAQKYDYDLTASAVETTVKQIEKIITGARSHISANQYATYNSAIATRLEHLANRLRGKTADPAINVEGRVQ